MAKTIEFNFKGVDYKLEFTRKSIETMERQGFKASEIIDKPMSTLPALFSGAFLAHHRFVKQNIVDEIFSKLGNKQELIGKLSEMFNEPILAMLDDPEDTEGNVQWGANW